MILNRTEKMKTSYILGAGFSRAMSDEMPLLKDLSEYIKKHPAFINNPEFKRLLWVSENNVEVWLTYLTQDLPWLSSNLHFSNKSMFLTMIAVIQDYFKTKQVIVRKAGGAGFGVLINYWKEHHSSVISMNYDTMVEEMYKVWHSSSFRELYPINIVPIGSELKVSSSLALRDTKAFKL